MVPALAFVQTDQLSPAAVPWAFDEVCAVPPAGTVPEQLTDEPPAPVVPAAPPAPVAAPPSEAELVSALEAWRAAWARQDLTAYLQSYGPGFLPTGRSRRAWQKWRRAIVGGSSEISIEIGVPQVTFIAADDATTAFTQAYRSTTYRDRVRKTLEWQRLDGRWVIVSETTRPLR